MKNILLQKLFRLLSSWIRSRFTRHSNKKPEFGEMKRHKKLSPKHEHLLKISKILKNRFRQKAWRNN